MKALKLSQMVSILALSVVSVMIIPACGGGGTEKAAIATPQAGLSPTIHINDQPALFIIPGSVSQNAVSVHKWIFTTAPNEVITEIHIMGEYQYVASGQPATATPSLLSTTLSAHGIDPTDATASVTLVSNSENTVLEKVPGRYLQFHSSMQVKLNKVTNAYFGYPGSTSFDIEAVVFYQPDWSGNIKNLRLMVVTIPCQQALASSQIIP